MRTAIAVDRGGDRRRVRRARRRVGGSRRDAGRVDRGDQRLPVRLPLGAGRARPSASSSRPSARFSSMSAPFHQPAIVRQVVRRDARGRLHGVARGGVNARAVALEPQHAVGEDVRGVEPLAQALGHGAEVLAHDEAARAMAFERERAEQVVERIARRRRRRVARRAVGNPEEAGERPSRGRCAARPRGACWRRASSRKPA